ncbi:MAG: tyrosine-protein phosphatase [Clostridia bacterium]|nr:tyrosine-protein phosphatase [Clostridia bacterium]
MEETYQHCPNLRDLGGLPASNGLRVRPGRLLRAGALWQMTAQECAALRSILAVFDLRSENERQYHPDPPLPGARYIPISVTESGRREYVQSKRTMEDKVQDILAGYARHEPIASLRMTDVYRRMILSPEMKRCLQTILRILANEPQGAVLFHCAAGKDRTGVVAAVLLRLLGVSDEIIFQDYLYTNKALSHELERAERLALAASHDPAAAFYAKGFFAACPCWLFAALSTMDSRFGSAEGYILHCTDITPDELTRFRNSCLVSTDAAAYPASTAKAE